ncbi:septum site-determining protein MinC [Pseudoalteromonas denitrificans]|uniref:Probable septum site-determining protein MinC n=1 Tax=Pseudoalteromonas denitrificans DSM 6059 TaxID=1123010 RepID=A0A1I1GVW7_9GAMM|nr:septum site-determining protein MinC [Pseudoalteromonas denitrificans]SFC13998.1 septum site-determining protein MinC [Pseudoalteromonas denitrificans DSM 6059]
MSEQIFELKGNLFTLSVLNLYKNDIQELSKQLDEKISQAPKFFYGAPIVINLKFISDQKVNFAELKQVLVALQLNPVGVCNGSDTQNASAKENMLSVLNYSQDVKPKVAKVANSALNTSIIEKEVYLPAQVIQGTVRSGQQVYAKDRDIIVLGAVSHGAEVIADGNIHIYGALRGRAIAGAKGNIQAQIFCQKLEAELVSIDGNYWISDSLQGDLWGQAAAIQYKDDSLEITALVKG